MRLVMAVVIFAVILPLAVLVHPHRTGSSPTKTTLFATKGSIFLMGVGALTIGLARTAPVLVAGKPYSIPCTHNTR
jgi:hypothetical protein